MIILYTIWVFSSGKNLVLISIISRAVTSGGADDLAGMRKYEIFLLQPTALHIFKNCRTWRYYIPLGSSYKLWSFPSVYSVVVLRHSRARPFLTMFAKIKRGDVGVRPCRRHTRNFFVSKIRKTYPFPVG